MKRLLIAFILVIPIMLFAETISVNVIIPAPQPELNQNTLVKMGYGSVSTPGRLQLPTKNINVLLPPGSTIIGHSLSMAAPNMIPGSAPLLNQAFTDGNKRLISSENSQNKLGYSFHGLHKWGDLRYASFTILPAMWDNGQWQWSPECLISVEYSTDQTSNIIPSTFDEPQFFVNASSLHTWYRNCDTRNYDILIIGTPELYEALSSWTGFRQSQGLVWQFTDIATALNQGLGTTDAEKLRSYLIDQYAINQFRYLLLLGDHDTVPVTYLTPEPDGMETVPSDFFYGDLSSDWDTDNDGRKGEYSMGFMDQDYGVDFSPEVFVGRLSTNDPSQIAVIANRIVAFEQSSSPDKDANLLAAAFLNYAGEPEPNMPQTNGADFMHFLDYTALSGQGNYRLYEQMGVVPSWSSDLPISYENFRNELNNVGRGFISWSAHGSAVSAARKIWVEDLNENNYPDWDEMNWYGLVDKSSFDNLANSDGTVIFSASCNNGMIDIDETSLAEYALIKKAVGFIGATRTGWYKVGWNNPGWGGLSSYNYHFVENYRQTKLDLGTSHAFANLLHSQYYLFGDPIDAGGIIWPELQNIYTYMLFGDPLIGYTPNPTPPGGELLVWEPNGSLSPHLIEGLREATGMNVIYSDKLIVDYDYINQFEAVFCLFGFNDDTYQLNPNSFEYDLITGYINHGGKLYMERAGYWDFADAEFMNLFGVSSSADDWYGLNQLSHLPSGQIWNHSFPSMLSYYLQLASPNASPLFYGLNEAQQQFLAACLYRDPSNNYRRIASTFSLEQGISMNNESNTLLRTILDSLAVATINPSPNADPNAVPVPLKVSSYPNPAKNVVNFSITLDKALPVTLEIYNIKGQKVRSNTLNSAKSGDNIIIWDTKDNRGKPCANGVYLYRLQAGKSVITGKQMLLK
jgi:hypothetical protein